VGGRSRLHTTLDNPLECGNYTVRLIPIAAYFYRLVAPSKKLVWFENSGHEPFADEPEKFNCAMAELVLDSPVCPASPHASHGCAKAADVIPEEPFPSLMPGPSAESTRRLVMISASPLVEPVVAPARDHWIRQSCGWYACPACKQNLEPVLDGLSCRVCARAWPIVNGIPDFLPINLRESRNRSLRVVGNWDSRPMFDFMASVYETWIYPAVCNLYGGWRSTSLQQLVHDISEIVGSRDGVILDVACGPGTYGRRMASASRTVIGVDICMSMMQRGARYVETAHIPNVHFARAQVEALPFQAGLFDAAICAGSLNHFSDVVLALREINRTMKADAPLAVMCFALINSGLIKYKSIRDKAEKGGGHIYSVVDFGRCVVEAGFEEFRPHTYGSILVFSARKRRAAN
jgi:ubiquinone/menaquinone biosynthesis C-methylase UbiE/uncharacterized protein YbaR (Trm112 family)